ncbi:ras and ef-hand domain-containing protein [Anaeramoeba flamelloides]|uniref:Ras and ef-hand domain-containing protein n=1 Tax=Anaeramoeba flamelloides TaxID=1746091 RepID=A0AAV7ZFH7_9EUKA|nr:ras and ef-hand domain-containing protein [Anaeramoeba flamelloides]KAJ6248776.1 ras and ef-hand domain-containing protein [Anaeramoeba flamelloides]
MTENSNTYSYKIVFLGESGVGKTSILVRYHKNKFSPTIQSTIGSTNFQKTLNLRDNKYQLLIWDTAGQERYKSLSQMYYRGARGVFIIFDQTNYQSFEKAQEWVEEVKQEGYPNAVIVLVGNKMDLTNKVVDEKEVLEYTQKNDLLFFETSAKTGYGIKEAFIGLVRKLPLDGNIAKKKNENSLNSNVLHVKQTNNKSSCC